MELYGKYNSSGGVEKEPTHCIFTERPLQGQPTVRERVKDTDYFYRILSSQYHRVTDEDREKWQSAPKSAARSRVSSASSSGSASKEE